MKILIIGGNSSLGKSLRPILSNYAEVITAGRTDCDVHVDLNDPIESINLPPDIDTIIHTAASFGGESEKEILEAESFNVLGTLKLCQKAANTNITHLILISTIFVTLEDTSAFYNVYSLSKRHSEDVAKFCCSTHNLPLTILRPSQIYGAGDSFRIHQPFFNFLLEKAEKGENITLYGSVDPLRNYIYMDDVVNIISKVVITRIEGTYACTQMADVTYSQIARAAFDAYKTKGEMR
ncbi:MAG: SDR family oxidoreductase, partial [Phycisphaerae bacterium]|nr:SDR family oxidoreductase [Phycisphaerae bacterium]